MANEQNLANGKATQFKSGEQAAEAGRRGGRASGRAKRRRKAFAEAFEVLLAKEYEDSKGKTADGIDVIALTTFKKAMKGDMKAIQFIRDTVGEMPVQRVEVDTIDQQARAEMDELLGLGDE